MRRRRGFTLIEVLIAVVLVDVGLLALVAAGGVMVRRTTELRLRATAVGTAADRLQLLGTTGCVAVTGTVTGAQGIREFWSATPPANGVRELYDSVAFDVVGVERAIALRTRLSC